MLTLLITLYFDNIDDKVKKFRVFDVNFPPFDLCV